jgi:diaminohydroxyphosphoribosylaminopyrimidine deaminase/5-amino-6-(5-phosphoribosylamino)uracil reductase
MVGAVVVKGRRIVGEGYHRYAGADHAERVALKQAGAKASAATLYVNLEPCCHTGRTGPCTEAIIKAGIRKVVFSVKDPDRRVNGKGAAALRRAGVTVANGLLQAEAQRLNEVYIGYHRNQRPFVILKTAQTVDGRIATATGDSKWISSLPSRKLAHRLRAEVDAVVVGMGTVRKDDPALTVRLVQGKDPYRIIVSRSLRFPRRCRLLDENTDTRTIIATTAGSVRRFSRPRRAKSGGLIFWTVRKRRDGLLDLHDFLDKANDFGLRSLLVEGGSRLATSFLSEGLVDKYVAFVAPKIVGEGIVAVGQLQVRTLPEAVSLRRFSVEQSGPDFVFTGYPVRSKERCLPDS